MPEPEATMSIGKLIVEASTVVQLVMLILLAASVSSWAFIFRKHRELSSAVRGAVRFEQGFWSGGSLSEIYNKVKSHRDHAEGGMGRIFGAGFQEFSRMRQKASTAPDTVVEASQRAMRVAYFREMDNAERFLPFLATVGSTSPYIGLFGTVWGIMNSFIALGAEKQATLATVAPGIAEALIATALGLFAAIPAVIAYNRYASHVERLGNRYEIFMEEFISILHRHAHGAGGPES